jgi:phage terminase small subunit
MPLRPKQRAFVAAYCTCWNAAEAARQAGYRDKRADQAGYQLLRNSEVQKAIQERQQELQGQYEVSQQNVIEELARIAFADMGAFLQWGQGEVILTPSASLPEAHRRAVKQVSITTNSEGSTTVRLTLHDKCVALDRLCRHFGLYRELPVVIDLSERLQTAAAIHAEIQRRLDALAAKQPIVDYWRDYQNGQQH